MLLFLACADPEGGVRKSDAPERLDSASDSDPVAAGTLGVLRSGGAARLDVVTTVNYRFVDGAWDEASDAFLVVYGNAPIGGAVLDADGAQTGGGFLVTDAAYDGSNWTQNPRVTATDGGFLVSWHEDHGDGPTVEVRAVRIEGGAPVFDAPSRTLSSPGSAQESPPAIAYAPEREAALVVWAQDSLRGLRVDAGGVALGAEVELTAPGEWVEMPAVAWVPGCDCWFVSVMQQVGASATVQLLRVDGASGAAMETATNLSGALEFAKVTDLTWDGAAGEVIASWYQVSGGVAGFAAVRLDADGKPASAPQTIFAPYGSYDGYDLAWSPVTGTSLAAFHGSDVAAYAEELARDGTDGDALALDLAGAASGVYLPRVVAHPTEAAWLVMASPDYAGVSVERIVHE